MNEHLYFVYLHHRHDKSEIFYVGKGKIRTRSKTTKSRYERAYEKRGRNKQWESIVSRTSYDVKIYQTFETEQEAFDKEIELIAFYGRKCFGSGTLINLDKGGQADVESRPCGRGNFKNDVPIFVYDSNSGQFLKKFPSISACTEELGIGKTSVHRSMKLNGLVGKFILSRSDLGLYTNPLKTKSLLIENTPEGCISLYDPNGNLKLSCDSLKAGQNLTGIKPQSIRDSIKIGKVITQGSYKDYFWHIGNAPTAAIPVYKESERIVDLLLQGFSPREISEQTGIGIEKCHKVKYRNKGKWTSLNKYWRIKKNFQIRKFVALFWATAYAGQ